MSSAAKVRRSSSMLMMEGWRKMTLLMALTGDMVDDDEYELRALLARDEADDDRRNEVRMLWGEKRAARAWRRVDCIMMDVCWWFLVGRGWSMSERREWIEAQPGEKRCLKSTGLQRSEG